MGRDTFVPAKADKKVMPDVLGAIFADKGRPTQVAVSLLQTNGGTQMRAGLDDGTVFEYTQAMIAAQGWGEFPAVIAYHDGAAYWLADGFHRVAAFKDAFPDASKQIPVEVRAGTRRDAILHAAGANANHGLRRTNADKRRAVDTLLRDSEWKLWGDREIARQCNVHHQLVAKVRSEVEAETSHLDDHPDSSAERLATRNGTTYTVNTANIGKPAAVFNTPPAEVDAPPTNGHVGYSFSDVVRIATSHVQRGQEAAARDVSPLRLAASNHVISDDPNYDGDEWYTPSEYIEAARTVMGGIDLDPASCDVAQEVVQAAAYYTKQDNGLAMPWMGSVWLNPPYSMPLIRQFVAKLIDQYEGGNVTEAVILTNNSSDTAWFHDLLSRFPACFTRGRVQFWRADHETFGARQGQTLFYLGSNTAEFVKMFSQFGQVVSRV